LRRPQDAEETLQGCFELTDWDVLFDGHGQYIDRLTGCITDYVHFCTDCVNPTKTVHCFPNNKPWVELRKGGDEEGAERTEGKDHRGQGELQ